jgi:cytochrome c-type biogenesis protein CcmH
MSLWIILTTMTAIVAVWAAIPFLRRADATEASNERAKSPAVYRDQLRQIDAELKAGIINEADAQATKVETVRRLVLAEREEAAKVELAQVGNRNFVAIGIASAVAVGSAILYAKIGVPERMAIARGADDAGNRAVLPARHPAVSGTAGRMRTSSAADGQGGEQGGMPTVDGMIERLAQRLKVKPEDGNGWRTLALSYAAQGRFTEAATAYDEAIKRLPENADLFGARGELLVRAGNGLVTPEAAGLFEEALMRDKENPRARFFLGLKKEQAGDRAAALEDWIAILRGASPSEPWVRDLRERIEQTAADIKVDLTGRLPAEHPAAQIGGIGPGVRGALQEEKRSGSLPADAQRAAAASPEDQMIRNMVDGLAARLEKQPRDFEGWSRLIRSRTVLGEMDKAKTALAKAREIFADTPEALGAISATAREVGLEP